MNKEFEAFQPENIGRTARRFVGGVAIAGAVGLGVHLLAAELNKDADKPETVTTVMDAQQRKILDTTAQNTANKMIHKKDTSALLGVYVADGKTTIVGAANETPKSWHTIGLTFDGAAKSNKTADVQSFIARHPHLQEVEIIRDLNVPPKATDLNNDKPRLFSVAVTPAEGGKQSVSVTMPHGVIHPEAQGYADLSSYSAFELGAALADGIPAYWRGFTDSSITTGEVDSLLPSGVPRHVE
jgi:hypothetical protein